MRGLVLRVVVGLLWLLFVAGWSYVTVLNWVPERGPGVP